MESFKATVHHIKQVAGDPQTAQINLLRHQHTELPTGKYKKKSSVNQITSNKEVKVPKCKASTRSNLMSRVPTKAKTDAQSEEIQLM